MTNTQIPSFSSSYYSFVVEGVITSINKYISSLFSRNEEEKFNAPDQIYEISFPLYYLDNK